jgi:hypothetical protein
MKRCACAQQLLFAAEPNTSISTISFSSTGAIEAANELQVLSYQMFTRNCKPVALRSAANSLIGTQRNRHGLTVLSGPLAIATPAALSLST